MAANDSSIDGSASSRTRYEFTDNTLTPLGIIAAPPAPAPTRPFTIPKATKADMRGPNGKIGTPSQILANINKKIATMNAAMTDLPPPPAPLPSLGICDLEAARARDTKAVSPLIEKDPSSFISGLHAIVRRRRDFPAWLRITKLQRFDTADPPQPLDAPIDLLTDFHQIDLSEIEAIARFTWSLPNAHCLALDGVSQHYSKKCLADLVFNSLSNSLCTVLQNLIPEFLQNDGPFVWLTLARHIFPSNEAFALSITNDITNLTISKCPEGLTDYTDRFRKGLLMLSNRPEKGMYTAFFAQMATHPSPTFVRRFSDLSIAHYTESSSRMTLLSMLSEADRFHAIVDSPAMSYKMPKDTGRDNLISLAAASSPNPDLSPLVALLADVKTHVLAALQAKSPPPKSRQRPPWFTEKPADVSSTCSFNGATWHWCALCRDGRGQWSTSHSTDGKPDLKLDAHRGHPSSRKRSADNSANLDKANAHQRSIKALKSSFANATGTIEDMIAEQSSASNQ